MIKKMSRLWQIQRIVSRYGLREFIDGKPRATGPREVRLRLAIEELGPVFVKFGQALSTRPDILPPEIALELAKLQDKVTAVPRRAGAADHRNLAGQTDQRIVRCLR